MESIFNNPNFWTIIGVVIGVLSLYYAYKTYVQKAKIELFITTNRLRLNDPSLNLIFDEGYSQKFKFGVSVFNIGAKNSNSITILLTFNSNVKILTIPEMNKSWKEKNVMPNYRIFHYNNDTKIHPPKTNYTVGNFEISIPFIDHLKSGFYFIANGIIEGDFEKSCFLVLYDIHNDSLVVRHYQKRNINDGNNDWNLMIRNKNNRHLTNKSQ